MCPTIRPVFNECAEELKPPELVYGIVRVAIAAPSNTLTYNELHITKPPPVPCALGVIQ
jgi:hypothetical protein